jgi:tetratricopeptide (TPR) repeat protein
MAIGAAVALFCLHNAAYADVQAGVDAWRGGDYAQAVSEWQPLADAGDPDAQFNLGQAYKLGRGVPQDMSRARDLFGLAAAQGHLQAEANYGLILFQEGNREQAMPYIVRAAEAGEPRAQYIYGTALFNGDLAPRDWPRAYALMTNASAAGIPQASASLQQMDSYIPIEQREQGREMASQMAEANPTTPVGVSPRPAAPSRRLRFRRRLQLRRFRHLSPFHQSPPRRYRLLRQHQRQHHRRRRWWSMYRHHPWARQRRHRQREPAIGGSSWVRSAKDRAPKPCGAALPTNLRRSQPSSPIWSVPDP